MTHSASRGRPFRFPQCGACVLAIHAGLLAAVPTAIAADPPNVIVILADDLGTEAIEGAAWGNELACHTPNLARWASAGRMFTNARMYPVCSPTRAALMTGREGLRTGVVGVLWPGTSAPVRRKLSLQTQESTIAEALQSSGYTTILVDKWHLAWDEGIGVMPNEQGFDVFYDYRDTLALDDPIAVGDEHITLSVDQAIDAVRSRPQPNPYALFFCTVDPHQREDPSGRERLQWWKVDERLLPSGENYYAPENDNNLNRYRAVVEALDTELFRMLRALNVVDNQGRYRENSNTVVFFLSDNGSPRQISVEGNRAKGSLYERGTRVPLLVFGEGVPSDGAVQERLVSAVDLYETIADVAQIPLESRGSSPRDSRSFADQVGYTATGPARTVSVAGLSDADNPSRARAAITDGAYKLIARGGGPMLEPLTGDEFYHLNADPREVNDLVRSGMNADDRAVYLRLRDELVDHWPSAVSVPSETQVDIPVADIMWIDDRDNKGGTTLTLGTYHPGRSDQRESRVLVRFQIDRLGELLPHGKTVDDITGAQIAFGFARESVEADETDTGVIRAHPMTSSWRSSGNTRWDEIHTQYDPLIQLGSLDLSPHIIANPPGTQQFGVPLTTGTPLSLGHTQALVEQVRQWYDDPRTDNGAVLIVDVLPDLDGDQRIFLMNRAVLRVTLD